MREHVHTLDQGAVATAFSENFSDFIIGLLALVLGVVEGGPGTDFFVTARVALSGPVAAVTLIVEVPAPIASVVLAVWVASPWPVRVASEGSFIGASTSEALPLKVTSEGLSLLVASVASTVASVVIAAASEVLLLLRVLHSLEVVAVSLSILVALLLVAPILLLVTIIVLVSRKSWMTLWVLLAITMVVPVVVTSEASATAAVLASTSSPVLLLVPGWSLLLGWLVVGRWHLFLFLRLLLVHFFTLNQRLLLWLIVSPQEWRPFVRQVSWLLIESVESLIWGILILGTLVGFRWCKYWSNFWFGVKQLLRLLIDVLRGSLSLHWHLWHHHWHLLHGGHG